jgi:hypothetical protein
VSILLNGKTMPLYRSHAWQTRHGGTARPG